MPTIDLTEYVVSPVGAWFETKEHFKPEMLTLAEPTDGVTLAGPLRVRVSIQAQNTLNQIGTSVVSVQTNELCGYDLNIPPGYMWRYAGLPFVLRDANVETGASITSVSARAAGAPATEPPALASSNIENLIATAVRRRLMPGVNDRLVVAISPGRPEACIDPCAPLSDPCKPATQDCHCGCGSKPCRCHTHGDDIGCDFAVANIPDMGVFFPAACEPCTPGASIGMPTLKGPTLIVPPARGGTVRTRYFNGMFMTSEDLETDQRNGRLKRALMNRALGQGVVWGLNVSADGGVVCVRPGYGVDCCGNDIVVTTPYRVDAQALLRDPAAALLVASRKPQRFSLVLEYFECPEQPRPVHGDPCAPDVTRCETSRIRETSRLRLVPPCEIDDSGPIKDFLAEIDKLKTDPQVGPIFAPAPTPQPGNAPALSVPFTVKVEALGLSGAPSGSVTLTPRLDTDPHPLERGDIAITEQPACRITVTAAPGFQFIAGATAKVLELSSTGTPTPINKPVPANRDETRIGWQDQIGGVLAINTSVDPIVAGFGYEFQNWRLKHQSGQEFEASGTRILLSRLRRGEWAKTPYGQPISSSIPDSIPFVLHVQVPASRVRAVGQPPQFPCFNESCDPEKLRFPVMPPWLHEDPTRPGQAADPRVIVLALVYSWLALEMARSKLGTSQPVNTGRLQVAAAIYHAAWRLFFGTAPDTDRLQLTDALQRLLRAWCCALLYPGPTCHCEPHGVVLGCASVSGGQIQGIDPWGGRRWVVHYPLLSYWGQQFGIMPLDAIASKVFGLICCISNLPAPRLPVGRTDTISIAAGVSAGSGGPSTGFGSTINLGRALLVVDRPAEAEARIAESGLRPSRVVSVSPFDFVLRFSEALRLDVDPSVSKRPLVHFTVLGLPDFHLVAPGDPEGAPQAVPEPGRIRDLVRTAIARRSRSTAVPALLRTFTEDLSRNLIGAVAIDPSSPVATRLADSGITTLGALLGRSPEELHAEVLNHEEGEALAALLESAETDAAAVTKAVGDAVLAVATERHIFARADFRTADKAIDLAKRLDDKLTALKLKTAGTTLTDLVVTTAGEQ